MRIEMAEQAYSYKGLTIATVRGRTPFPFRDIVYVESTGKKKMNYNTKNEQLSTCKTLNELEAMLPSDLFCRVHRSFIVAYRYITCIHHHTVSLNNRHIPIGRTYANRLNAQYIHL